MHELSVASAVLTPRWVVAKVLLNSPPSGGLPTPDLGTVMLIVLVPVSAVPVVGVNEFEPSTP